ncbi:phosphoribosylformylglycinamidine synthase subunit PurS [Acidianus manzaensis]|uniref:Phosphoribosylformylglycinamidine synthase subunit PurS n=1 Tax=Acidianus manzaensis TaxID=282676 RepID=A0A1W6K192_9CREN|nr:phosphoribosylformylglycinamidine synthase subunit PurS [Acidianus manzaensis]ARM76265.1 phosphoribosylformylglycinamidine synthase, purS protein [Acidianus manzaensis]
MKVELIITNKEGVRDPEGETIQRYIVNKVTDKVKEVRAGKYLLFNINSDDKNDAVEIVKKIAEENRLYNPIVHKIEIRAEKIENGSN